MVREACRWSSWSMILIACAAACGGGGAEPARAPQTETTSANTPRRGMSAAEARAAASPGKLPSEHIHRRVVEQMDTLRDRCAPIEREIDRYEAMLHLEVGASGAVEVADARGNHPIVDACVSDVARTWHFAPSSGRTVADVPIALLRGTKRR